jgi:hypothetical protein
MALPGRRLAIVLLLIVPSCVIGHAAEFSSWQRVPSESQLRGLLNLPTVRKTEIYEVVPTKIETAIVWDLGKVSFAVLSCEAADFLVGGHYSCEDGKKPVLVRAVYANGGTGNFTVHFDSSTVYVHHGSLGDLGVVRNLPVIVSLPFIPLDVVAWASSAK